MTRKKLLKEILLVLRDLHYHADRMEVFYKMVHNIREDKSGAWIQDKKVKESK